MGAFFLHNTNVDLALPDARHLFEKKGFAEPREIKLGNWRLWLYQKQLIDTPNFVEDEGGQALYCTGTVVYRGLGYRASLKRLLADTQAGKLDQDELLGSFCLLFWNGQEISVLLDRSRTYHVFCNEAKTCLSSSFLAVLEASPRPLPLNRLALCEKLSTGYIVSPDTLVEGIQQVDADVGESFSSQECGLAFLPVAPRPPIALHKAGIKDSIAQQIAKLQTHFKAMDALHCEMHGDLGMSSGYDSRLILACAKNLSKPMGLYTHGTQGVHDKEAGIASQLAACCNQELHQISTHRTEDQSADEITRLLDDVLYFQDGRCAHMGAFSEVHTRAYKERVMGCHRLGWNGLGGEMYRNYYHSANRPVNLRHWLNRHVFYPFAAEAWGDPAEYEAMQRRVVAKMFHKLGAPIEERVDFLWLRRYYSEIRMPDCNAIKNNAHDKVAFFHTPFMDADLVSEALNATPYIGCNGAYQAQLIRELSPALAAFKTHYGHSLERIPMRMRIQSMIKCNIPEQVQLHRLRKILQQSGANAIAKHQSLVKRVPIFLSIHDALLHAVPQGQLEAALIHYAQRPTAIFVGSFLHAFQHKIRLRDL